MKARPNNVLHSSSYLVEEVVEQTGIVRDWVRGSEEEEEGDHLAEVAGVSFY